MNQLSTKTDELATAAWHAEYDRAGKPRAHQERCAAADKAEASVIAERADIDDDDETGCTAKICFDESDDNPDNYVDTIHLKAGLGKRWVVDTLGAGCWVIYTTQADDIPDWIADNPAITVSEFTRHAAA